MLGSTISPGLLLRPSTDLLVQGIEPRHPTDRSAETKQWVSQLITIGGHYGGDAFHALLCGAACLGMITWNNVTSCALQRHHYLLNLTIAENWSFNFRLPFAEYKFLEPGC